MEEKKKRGCNYTAADKEILLKLIYRYHNIIENKETNAVMVSKKQEAWISVCHQYNAVATSGFRTWKQLRHLYENLKQRSKKNSARIFDIPNEVQKLASLVKKETNDTSGETLEQDAQILAMIAPQVQLLSNDDSAIYFGEECKSNKRERYNGDKVSSEIGITANNTEQENPKQKERSIKQQYFKAKLRKAKLENKYLINRNKMEINKYKLEMQILKLRLRKLMSPRKH